MAKHEFCPTQNQFDLLTLLRGGGQTNRHSDHSVRSCISWGWVAKTDGKLIVTSDGEEAIEAFYRGKNQQARDMMMLVGGFVRVLVEESLEEFEKICPGPDQWLGARALADQIKQRMMVK